MFKAVNSAVLLIIVLCAAEAVFAKQVQLPLHLDTAFIDQLVRSQMFTGKNHSTRLMDDGSGCRFVMLSDPKTGIQNGYIRVLSKANIRVGTRVGKKCMLAVNWQGMVEVLADLKISPQQNVLNLNVVESKIFSDSSVVDTAVNAIWGSVQPLLPNKFSQIKFDVREPVNNLKSFLPELLPHLDRAMVTHIVDSLVVSSTQVLEDGVRVQVDLNVPDLQPTQASTPQRILSPQEMQTLEKRFEALDAFLTFVIKTAGSNLNDKKLEAELFDMLIETRYTIRDALSTDETTFDVDPVKALFVSVWKQLRPVVSRLAAVQPDSQSLHLISFITAADALQTIDEVGPELGVDVSVDGLRRLARILMPATKEDPVEYKESVDPALRNLFKMGFLDTVPVRAGSWMNFFVNDAVAADMPSQDVLNTLNTSLPSNKNMSEYLQGVSLVISYAVAQQLAQGDLDKSFHAVYEDTVYTAAWQESCWRQFVSKKGQRVPLRSGTGDVGMMQINTRVWRGIFDLNELRWNMLYNAEAGSEILMRYMKLYAIANDEQKKPGGLDNLARSTYSAYNGGPKRYARYRLSNTAKLAEKIDRLFYDKYLVIKKGDKFAVRDCLVGG